MNKKVLIYIILLLCGMQSFTQVFVEGTVSKYNSKGANGNPKWIQGAIVLTQLSEGGMTDTYGLFKIEFGAKHDGTIIKLKVNPPQGQEYKWFTIVEEDRLKEVKIGGDMVRLSMWSKKECKARTQELAQPLIDEKTKQYEEKISKLNRENRDSINRLNVELNLMQKYLIEFAEKMARINPDFADERQQKALEFIDKGNLDSIDRYLPSLNDAMRNIEIGKQDLKIRIGYYKAKPDFDSILIAYRVLLSYSKGIDEFEFSIECSEYLFNNRIYGEKFIDSAFVYAEKAKEPSEKLAPYYKIKLYNLLGTIQEKQNKQKNYYKNYQKAIKLYKQSKDNREFLENSTKKEIAISYTLFGNYFFENKQYRKAEKQYLNALDIYIDLNKNEEYDELNQINMLLRLASVYNIQKKQSLVSQCIERIDALRMQGDEMQSDRLAILDEETGNYELVCRNFQAAIGKYEAALNYHRKGDERSLNYYRKGNEDSPKIDHFKMAKLYYYIGEVHRYSKNYSESINYLDSALTEMKKDTLLSGAKLCGFINASMYKSYQNNKDSKSAEQYLNIAKTIANNMNYDDLKEFIRQNDDDRWMSAIMPSIRITGGVAVQIISLLFPLL